MGELLIPAVFNWSGGKDSAFALWELQRSGKFDVRCLVTTLSEKFQRISMHGVRRELLLAQSALTGIPLHEIFLPENATMEQYGAIMESAAEQWKSENIFCAGFGDLFLEDLKQYRTDQLAGAGVNAIFPIWGIPTGQLAQQFIENGFKTIVVATDNSKLDASFCGRLFDKDFLDDLPPNVDPCGENGEFHTFCFDGPIFKEPVQFQKGEITVKTHRHDNQEFGFTFCDLLQ